MGCGYDCADADQQLETGCHLQRYHNVHQDRLQGYVTKQVRFPCRPQRGMGVVVHDLGLERRLAGRKRRAGREWAALVAWQRSHPSVRRVGDGQGRPRCDAWAGGEQVFSILCGCDSCGQSPTARVHAGRDGTAHRSAGVGCDETLCGRHTGQYAASGERSGPDQADIRRRAQALVPLDEFLGTGGLAIVLNAADGYEDR